MVKLAQGEWMTVKWEDLDGNIRELEKIKHDLQDEIDQILLECALIVEAEVKRLIKEDRWEHETAGPDGEYIRDLIDTGYMRESVFSYVEHTITARYGVTAVGAEYAKWVNDQFEFMEVAMKNVEEEVIAHFEERTSDLIDGGW